MECRKKLTGDILEQPRSLEFLCRTCGVVECGMCSLANHTKSECAIVKLTVSSILR